MQIHRYELPLGSSTDMGRAWADINFLAEGIDVVQA